jgi:RimJ/RimL family protein N-acetyltransferase
MASELRSHRLILRALRSGDAVQIAALLHDDRDAIRRMSHMPDPCTVEAAREWIARRTAPGSATFAIVRAADGVFLGAIGFGSLPEMPGVGYWIGRPHWGQGYATEALQLIVAYARGLGAKGLQAETFPDNPASARVLAKCGFQDRGLGLRDYPARGGLVRVRIHILHFATHDARAESGCDEGSSS